jgi:hypothetical protein
MVEHLPSKPSKSRKHEALSSSPATPKKKKKQNETLKMFTDGYLFISL